MANHLCTCAVGQWLRYRLARASLILFTSAAALVSGRKNILEDKNLSCETLCCSSCIDCKHREVRRPKCRHSQENTVYAILPTILNPETHEGSKMVTSQTNRVQFLSPKKSKKCFALFLERPQNCEKPILVSPCVSVHLSVCMSVSVRTENSAPTGRIFIKFCIWVFSEILSRKFKFANISKEQRVLYMKTNIHFYYRRGCW